MMDGNLRAWKLGKIAREAGNPKRKDVGDLIDRGLILERLLNAQGFELVVASQLSYENEGARSPE